MGRGGIDPCGSGDRPRADHLVYILATLCRFDDNMSLGSKIGPFIPCERRLAKVEILEIQGRGLSTAFWNRDYGRPHRTFPVTLRIYD